MVLGMKGSILNPILSLSIIISVVSSYEAYATTCELQKNCKSTKLKLQDLIKQPVIKEESYFRAALYEHDRIDLITPNKSARANLEAYEKAAKLASSHGAKIIVFPEDGLYDMPTKYLEDVLEQIPDPDILGPDSNNPCDQTAKFINNPILTKLSCMSKENRLYIVANFGTKEPCIPNEIVDSQKCPGKGQFDFNTNVVLGPDGRYLKRYRKWNMFIEAFDRATDVEFVFFDTPLGRFGLVTCFDMLFKRPAIDLVEIYEVDTLLFPTWWYDELPILTAISTQEGWSRANGVNLIAANIHKLAKGSIGSGIYSTNGDFIHTSSEDTKPKLLIANLPKRRINYGPNPDIKFDARSIDLDSNNPMQSYTHTNYRLTKTDSIATLTDKTDNKTLCNNEICCTLNYEITQDTYDSNHINRLIMVVRDSLRYTTFKWYEQVCFVAELTSSKIDLENPKNNNFAEKATFNFHRLELSSNFNTKHVFPMALHDINKLVSRTHRDYDCSPIEIYPDNPLHSCKHRYIHNEPAPIISFSLYGRVYERDQIDYSKSNIKTWPDDTK